MPNRRVWLLLLLAVVLRLLTQGWDSGLLTPHPDERQVAFVSEKAAGWFSDPGFFAYGSFHFRAVRAMTFVLGQARNYEGLLLGGRALSLLASIVALVLGWWMARRAWGHRTAELFLLLIAFVPLDIQQSHYATVEAHHAAWVMLALAGCFWLATRSGWIPAAVAGAAVGASLAVKIASLPMLLPLGLALWIGGGRRDGSGRIELAGVAAAAAVAAFYLGQPWAFFEARPPLVMMAVGASVVALAWLGRRLRGIGRYGLMTVAAGLLIVLVGMTVTGVLWQADGSAATSIAAGLGPSLNPAYRAGVGEQVAMVMGSADLPYVRVYEGTLPILYPLRELGRWGIGPMLLLVVVGAVLVGSWRSLWRMGRWLGRRTTPGAVLLVLVLAWTVPMSVRLSTLHVKYLRYFEPLVVPFALLAAWWLVRLSANWRRPVMGLTVAGTALWGVMYLWAFAAPHPHRTAALWMNSMVSEDQIVAFEHWDETLGLKATSRIDLPSYDLPDDEAKVRRWGEALGSADWVVMTSNRVRRTVLVNRDRFPRTGRLYKLLLTGEAGYEPVARVDRAPRLFGLFRPVQLADESYLNYDFPRVVVLRRVEAVDVDRLVERTARPLPYLEQLDAADLERVAVQPLARVPFVPGPISQMIQLILWGIVLLGSGLAAWTLLLPVVRSWPDAGFGLSLVTGWIVPAWVMWLGSELGLWPVGEATATWIFLAMIGGGAAAGWRNRRLIARLWPVRRRGVLLVASVAAVVWLTFCVVRAGNPAIFWGEKPMDFSFLNAFLRAQSWPPDEPWMAGMPLHYYYFGQVLASVPILTAGVHPAVGYNLMSATIPAFGAALLAALGLALARRSRLGTAVLLPLLVLLTGNLAWPRLMDLAGDGRWFDMWWATSRVIPGFAIDEYPLWTALFADLHGHFIALPVLLITLLWGWLVVVLPDRRWLVAAALAGICAAVLAATNPWDIFVLASALAVGTVVAAKRPVRGLVRLLAAGAASLMAGLPYIVELIAGIGAGAGGRGLFLTTADFAPAWAVLVHFGQFLVPLIVLALAVLLSTRAWMVALPVAAAGVGLGFMVGSSAAALALASATVMAMAAVKASGRVPRLMWSLAGLAMVAVAACERFTLIDRMNTIFKFYNGAWVLLAVAVGGLLISQRGWRRAVLAAVWVPLQLVALVNLPLGIAQGWLQPRTPSPRPTLDGQAFLAEEDPQTWFLVRGLQGMATPPDVVAEAADIAYAQFTRVAMHTGQPTVVGWPYHLQQRGQSRREIDARYSDLLELYAGRDPYLRRGVLDRYRVRWVALADVERRTYGLADSDPFASVPGVIQVASRKGAALYMVRPSTIDTSGPSLASEREIPDGVRALATLPTVPVTAVLGVGLDHANGTVVMPDGSLVELDAMGRTLPPEAELPCSATSVVRRQGVAWAACADGSLWLRDGRLWRALGVVEGATHLAVGDDLWAWGENGLWRLPSGGSWTRVGDESVAAAAAFGPSIAISDGRAVWALRDGAKRLVGAPLEGVRALAWQGASLWALTESGLYRSGGALLPWQRDLGGLEDISAIAGAGDRLWLVLDDGLLLQHVRQRCGSPWQGSGLGAELEQPRGLVVSDEGWFAVADTGHDRVVWFTMSGTCLASVGVEGNQPGAFVEPSGLSLGADGAVAVCDTWNGRVQVLRPNGSIQVLGANLYGPRDVLWAPDGSLFVADTGNKAVLRFRPPRWKREEILRFPAPVVGLAWVDGLLAAAVPVAGEVVLIDVAEGEEVRRLQVPGWQSGEQQESYLAMLPSGELLASAPFTGELWRIDPSGERDPVRVPMDLPGVTGIAVLPDGRVLASQTFEHRLVQVDIDE